MLKKDWLRKKKKRSTVWNALFTIRSYPASNCSSSDRSSGRNLKFTREPHLLQSWLIFPLKT